MSLVTYWRENAREICASFLPSIQVCNPNEHFCLVSEVEAVPCNLTYLGMYVDLFDILWDA